MLLFFMSLTNADGPQAPQATLSNRRRCCRVLKGGEEVRTDQRVEQLFDVVNGLLRRSPAAAAASLQVGPALQTCAWSIMSPGESNNTTTHSET